MKALIAFGILGCISTFSVTMIEGTNHGWLAIGIPTGLLCIWLALCFLTSIWSHVDDLGRLAAKDIQIAAATERLESVKALAADKHGLPEQLLALNQDDNPVTRYMSLVSNAITNLETEKGYKASIEGRIKARAIGPFSIVVTVFGATV